MKNSPNEGIKTPKKDLRQKIKQKLLFAKTPKYSNLKLITQECSLSRK